MTANQLQGRLLDPADALRFVVEFAQVDLAQAPTRQLRQVAWGVQLLINRETPGHWAKKAGPDLVLLQALQDRARAILEQFVKGPVAIEGDLLLTFLVTRDDEGRVRVQVHGRQLDLFAYQLVRVLETGGAEKLLACPAPECGRIFLKVTKKRFCSQRCQSRIYMRQLRADERAERDALTKGARHGKTTRTR
jgi:CGNR zinc finger